MSQLFQILTKYINGYQVSVSTCDSWVCETHYTVQIKTLANPVVCCSVILLLFGKLKSTEICQIYFG